MSPQTSSVWWRDNQWNGQLAITTRSSVSSSGSVRGSYPWSGEHVADRVQRVLLGTALAGGGRDRPAATAHSRSASRKGVPSCTEASIAAAMTPAGQVVLPVGQRHGHLALGAPVQLGGPPRAGPAPPGQPAELDLEQALVDQPVQVELRRVPGDADARGRLVAAHRLGLADHEQVEVAAHRLGERGHPATLPAKSSSTISPF